jgi:uncharacterized membrane protein
VAGAEIIAMNAPVHYSLRIEMATQSTPTILYKRSFAISANRAVYRFSRTWMLIFSSILVIYVILPILAPIFMQLGWSNLGIAIYQTYSYLCHQLPQRSYFLFGQKASYSLGEIQAVWQNTIDPLILKQFIGSSQFGWKMAWSDRMVSMYTSIPLIAWGWWPIRKKVKPLGLIGFLILLLPMVIDGVSHMVSDQAGIGQGFRNSNIWLASLTGNAFSPNFYIGDALGSFNSWMRLVSGLLFGLGVVWFGFPRFNDFINEKAELIEKKFKRAGIPL